MESNQIHEVETGTMIFHEDLPADIDNKKDWNVIDVANDCLRNLKVRELQEKIS